MNKGFNSLWPTDVYFGEVDQKRILENFIQTILLTVNIDNLLYDFQSFDVLKEENNTTIQQFKNEIVWPAFENYLSKYHINLKSFPDRRLRSWLTNAKNGYMIPAHNHNGATLSAVFYLITEESDKGGELVLIDPRTNANRGYKDDFKPLFANKVIQPSSGEFIIIPSFVYHHTNSFVGSMRLAMPVDLFL